MYDKRDRKLICVLMLTSIIALTGCSKNNTDEIIDTTTVISETEIKETGFESEPVSEAVSMKDIQISVLRTGRKGNVNFELSDTNKIDSIAFEFHDSKEAFYAFNNANEEIYIDNDGLKFKMNEKWTEKEVSYFNFWELLYSDQCELEDETIIDNVPCYHLSIDYDGDVGSLTAFCYANGYSDVINGNVHYDFYINKDTSEICRVDIKLPFLAVKDGKDIKGELSGSISVTGKFDEKIESPQILESEESTYAAGNIIGEKNLYQNQMFDVQIIGNDLFSYDTEKTKQINDGYISSNSSYTEEAYAQGSGTILNISSIRTNGSTEAEILAKYLSDSKAENIQMTDPIRIGNIEYICAMSDINHTATKTYATVSDDRALLITFYYADTSHVSVFERSIYSMTDNPYWTEDSWILENKYKIITPSGYNIVKGESGDLYVCMTSANDEVNVFAIENSNIDTEIEKESQSTGDITREIRKREDITLADGSTMVYLTVFNSEPSYTYFTHVGFIQKDSAVIKLYVVSTADNADYKNIFTDFAQRISVITKSDEILENNIPESQSDATTNQ